MRYAAFISYSSLDRRTGEALQKALEAYVVPAPLRGQDFGLGPVPKRIAPVFRDRWDADASVDLGATLRAALHASDALIVLCSPASARSHWVGEEIREFKRVGRGERIFPVLIDGLPDRHDPQQQPQGAFHPGLFERWVEHEQRWQPEEREPLAPDVRSDGDGLRFAVLKLVAALTGVPLTTLTQRQADAERRERNIARGIAATMAVLALGASVGAWTSWRASAAARERLENAVEMAARRVDNAAGFRDRYGVPSSVIHEMLDGARQDFDELTADAPDTPTLALQRARLDRLFARLYEAAGDGAQQRAMAERALAALERVPTQRRLAEPSTWLATLPAPDKVEVERLLALGARAQALALKGDTAAAAANLERMVADADALRQRADSAVARSLAAQARSQQARLAYEAGRLDAALRMLQQARAIVAPNAAADPLEPASLHSEEAEMLLELGRHDDALTAQRQVVDELQRIDRPSPDARRTLAAAIARRGDMQLAARRDLAAARADYLRSRDLLAELLAQDGARTDVKRDLSLAHERSGDALLQDGDLAGARTEFEACLRLRRELVARDGANAEWQRDLTVALERIGGLQALQGRPREAMAAFDEALRLRQAVWERDRSDLVAARDLAVLWMRIGQAHAAARGTPAQIDTAYARAIELLGPLVAQAAADSRWRRDLAVAHAERGEARRRAGRGAQAREDFGAALSLVVALRAVAPDDAQLAADEAWLQQRLR
jgi:tetratricopeptide (TPR) repeat protein